MSNAVSPGCLTCCAGGTHASATLVRTTITCIGLASVSESPTANTLPLIEPEIVLGELRDEEHAASRRGRMRPYVDTTMSSHGARVRGDRPIEHCWATSGSLLAQARARLVRSHHLVRPVALRSPLKFVAERSNLC